MPASLRETVRLPSEPTYIVGARRLFGRPRHAAGYGDQVQIDFGQKRLRIAGVGVRIFL